MHRWAGDFRDQLRASLSLGDTMASKGVFIGKQRPACQKDWRRSVPGRWS